ncbi:MAG: tRNA (adenosine(37)-N6)-threonylcarbamoyltransferase complex transferase subunit TsaD, partial [Desulfovibrio sp.]|nr:tRNA (adenosine(37)-N6)-threonylcarbamoyltransferase complex transferase subunit TsaD [Desulfovibrio sp.]
ASYRLAVVDTLIAKTERALRLESMRGLRGLVLAGGVAANSLLRRRMAELAQRRGLLFSCPPPALCTDNGVMIAHLGCLLTTAGYGHDLGMEAVARGRAVPDDMRRFGP